MAVAAMPRPLQPMPPSMPGANSLEMRQEIGVIAAVPRQACAIVGTAGRRSSSPAGQRSRGPSGHARRDRQHRHAAADQAVVAVKAIGENIAAHVGNGLPIGRDPADHLGGHRLGRDLVDVERHHRAGETPCDADADRVGGEDHAFRRHLPAIAAQAPARSLPLGRAHRRWCEQRCAGRRRRAREAVEVIQRMDGSAGPVQQRAAIARHAGARGHFVGGLENNRPSQALPERHARLGDRAGRFGMRGLQPARARRVAIDGEDARGLEHGVGAAGHRASSRRRPRSSPRRASTSAGSAFARFGTTEAGVQGRLRAGADRLRLQHRDRAGRAAPGAAPRSGR